jgi:hypothetical protein
MCVCVCGYGFYLMALNSGSICYYASCPSPRLELFQRAEVACSCVLSQWLGGAWLRIYCSLGELERVWRLPFDSGWAVVRLAC